jgi:hypothetical protein|tara:strand:- start:364 stop:636 length:273 start_codon:yes stop_codon:yes gene_type:complete
MEKNQKIVLGLFITHFILISMISGWLISYFLNLDIVIIVFTIIEFLFLILGIVYSIKVIREGESFFGWSFLIFFGINFLEIISVFLIFSI